MRTILVSSASLLTLMWGLIALAEPEPIAASAEFSTEESSFTENLPPEAPASDALTVSVDGRDFQILNDNESYSSELLIPGRYETRAADLLVPVAAGPDSTPLTTAQTTDAETEDADTEGDDDFFEFEFEEGENLRLTVTGTRTPIPIENLPATVTVFELEDFDFYQVQGLADLLRYEPGVSVRNNLQYGTQDVNIRGIEGNRVLFQVDNIRLPERFEFGPFNLGRGDYVDFATLQAVEVLRGPASTLYGSDALGGVVTYRSLEPTDLLMEDDDFAADFSTTYLSATGGFTNVARAAIRQGEASAVFVVSRRDGREADTFAAEQFSDSFDREGTTIYGNFVYELDDYSRLNFIAEDFNRFSRRIEAPGNLGTLNLSEAENILIDRTRISFNYEYDNPENSSLFQYLQAQVYYQTATTTEQVVEIRPNGSGAGFAGDPARRDTENQFIADSYGGDVQLRSDFSTGSWDHRLTYGFDISSTFNARPRDRVQTNLRTGATTNSVGADTFPVKDFPDGETLRLGFYLQDEIEVGNLDIIAGLRFDYYKLATNPDLAFARNGAESADLSASAVSPRLALRYEVTPEISVYGQYSRGFRAPLYSEINSGFTNLTSPFFRYETLSNPGLEPETSNSFEIGVRGNFSQFDFGITGFYNTYDNFIETFADAGTRCLVAVNPCPGFTPPVTPTQTVNQFQTQNVSRARIYGLELSGEYRFSPDPHGFSILGSLAYVVGDDLTTNQPLTSIDPLTAVLGLRYQSPGDVWRAELISTLVGVARVPDTSTTFLPDAYTLFDFIGSYNLSSNVGLNLGVYNLFNTEYYNYSDIPLGLPGNAPDIARFSQPGTNVQLGVTFSF